MTLKQQCKKETSIKWSIMVKLVDQKFFPMIEKQQKKEWQLQRNYFIKLLVKQLFKQANHGWTSFDTCCFSIVFVKQILTMGSLWNAFVDLRLNLCHL